MILHPTYGGESFSSPLFKHSNYYLSERILDHEKKKLFKIYQLSACLYHAFIEYSNIRTYESF